MHTRLVLLLKAGPGSGSKIAHQAGFALYGNPPRWHQITAEKPAPKGAPVSHHPEAAGVHEPAQHFTDAQWAQLQLPDSNVNATSYNAALAKLKDWSEAGNVTAIVGAGFGTNTYGKKLALIANQLLKMHGSVHQVAPGQKAGTHAAVAVVGDKAPKAAGTPAEQGAAAFAAGKPASPAHDAGFAAKVAGKPDAADKINEWSSGYHAAKEAATPKPAGPLVAPEFTEGKSSTGVKALYDHTAAKIIDHGHAGNLSVLQDMVNPDKKMWQGKTPNSKKLVQLHAQALAYAAGGKPAAKAPPPPAPAPAPTPDIIPAIKAHIDGASQASLTTMLGNKALDKNVRAYAEHVYQQKFGPLPTFQPAKKKPSPKFDVSPDKSGFLKLQKLDAVSSVDDVASTFKSKPLGTKVGDLAEHEKFGFWVGLGAVASGALNAIKPKSTALYSPDAIEKAKQKFVTASDGAKDFMAQVEAGSEFTDLFRKGEKFDKNGKSLAEHAKAALDYATEMPEGTTIYRWQKFSSEMLGQIMSAPDGAVFQTTGPMSASYDPELNIDFGDHRMVIRYAKGAKAVDTFAGNQFKGEEGEITTLPNARFVILSKKMVADHEHDEPGTKRLELEVLMLPPDIGVDAAPATDTGPKEGDTKPGADGGTLVLKDGHWVKQPGADDLDSPEDMATDFTKPAAPVAAPTGNLSAQHLQNLQSIPWFKLKLPDSNTNAKSHNAALAKIEAMAFAGDKAGLQAFIDAKAGAKQTYAKKQALVAQTALAALGAEGATAAVPVEPAPAADKVTELTPKQIEGLKGWFKAGKPTSKHPDSWSNLWSKLSPGMKAAVKAEIEPAPSLAGKPAYDHIDHQVGDEYDPDKAKEAADAWLAANPGAWDELNEAVAANGYDSLANYGPEVEKPAAPAPITADTPLTQGQKDAVGKLSLDDMKAIIDTPLPPNVAAYVKKQIARAEKPAAPVKATTSATKLTNTTPGHNKWWAVSLSPDGLSMMTTYGKIGAAGQKTVKKFASQAAAAQAVEKLINEKKDKGYVYAGQVDHEHAAAPGSAPVEQGPKEGDTKMGADGMLVLKDGHWVKMNTGDDGPGDWAFNADDPGFSGANTVGNHEGMLVFSPGDGAEYHTDASMMANTGEPALQANTVQELVQKMVAAGHSVPPLAMLQKLDPGYTSAPKVGKILTAKELKAIENNHGGYAQKTYKNVIKPAVQAGNIEALQKWKQENVGKLPNTNKMVDALLVAMGAGAAPAEAPAAPASPAGGLPSMDGWVKTGEQQGSNAGGKFKDPSGQEWYCKFPGDADTAKSEILAAKLYALAGLSSQDAQLVTKGGKVGIATKWVNIKKAGSATALAKVDGVHQGFAVDAWLGNWDVVGMSLDNLQIGPDGKAHRVDAGGSLEYRAQGEKKPFGSKVEEIDTLRDMVKNPHSAAVFGKMTKADIAASVAKVAAISDIAIRAMVNQFGPGDDAAKKKLADTLIARKQDLISKYPQAAKPKKKPKFDAAKLSSPPSFLNWGGTGKSGPSSKAFLNQANEDAVQAIYQAAKSGDLEAVKNLTAPVYDKDSGKATGQKPVLDHPSQHVKGYAQQVINEINYQLNPPKRFRFDGGHPLHALNHAYPAHKGAKSSAVAQKLGKFIVLGEPGKVSLEEVGLPAKITHSEGGGTLSRQTYKAQAHAAWHKMPATQRQAVKSYTGSSYTAMNGSLWDGNPSGAAKAAAEALHTLGHDIAPGTVLSRHLTLKGKDLQDMLGAVGKVLQEPAVMSTSIRPSSWIRNVQLKLHVGPGVKGLWVGPGSEPGGGAISVNSSEDEMLLPPNTRLLIMSVRSGEKDADGFGGHGQQHVIEAIVLPTN